MPPKRLNNDQPKAAAETLLQDEDDILERPKSNSATLDMPQGEKSSRPKRDQAEKSLISEKQPKGKKQPKSAGAISRPKIAKAKKDCKYRLWSVEFMDEPKFDPSSDNTCTVTSGSKVRFYSSNVLWLS